MIWKYLFPAGAIGFLFSILMLVPSCTGERANYSGVWQTNWGNITLEQNGELITGFYTHDSGKIDAKVIGNTIIGRWSEAPSYQPPKDAGEFEFTVSENGKNFSSRWRYGWGGDGTSDYRYDWYGSKIK